MRQSLRKLTYSTSLLFYVAVLSGMIFFTGCKKQDVNEPKLENPSVSKEETNSEDDVVRRYKGITWRTLWELQQARAATAKYRNFERALADSFEDIHVVVPNMGYHFMKSSRVDSVFDVRKPEILVYNKNLDGRFQLVAVEYAVPISLSPDKAPEGFTGSADVWERNTTFGLWLQHAWVWAFNPAGVFHDTNPLIQVH